MILFGWRLKVYTETRSLDEIQQNFPTAQRIGQYAIYNYNNVICVSFRKENTFDMMGEDSLILARLVYTLGVIIYAAINTPVCKLLPEYQRHLLVHRSVHKWYMNHIGIPFTI